MSHEETQPFRAVVAGGGVAGLEAVLALSRLAPPSVDVVMLSPSSEFVDRSMLVAEAFGAGRQARLDLKLLAKDAGARLVLDSLASVDAGARAVATAGGATLPYDALLVAIGARPVEAVRGALTFGLQAAEFERLLASLGRAHFRRMAFVVPRGVAWSIAAYELALLTAAERDARGIRDAELSLVTDESVPLEALGPDASQLVSGRLEEAGVELHTSSAAESFEDGGLRLAGGGEIGTDAAVALPSLVVPELPGLEQTAHGFLRTDASMNVAGLAAVWAAGDVTAFPVKQGGLAAQQADVAARAIAVSAGARIPAEPFRPVLRAALITGGAPEFMLAPQGPGGESVTATGRALWWPPAKVAGRLLGPITTRGDNDGELGDVAPPSDPGAAEEEHSRIVYLLLAAAEDDAAEGRYTEAIRWLGLVEDLNLVLPPEYVARRHEWRLHLEPGAEPGRAVRRIDPRFESADAAFSELYRRVGSLRRSGQDHSREMREHLEHLEAGIGALRARTQG